MKNKFENVVKQHYIPIFVLKRFVKTQSKLSKFDRNSLLYQWNKISNSGSFQKIKDISVVNDLYEVFDNYGNYVNRNFIETKFCNFERKWGMIFKKLDNCDDLTDIESLNLMLFVIVQYLRIPKIIDMLSSTLMDFVDAHQDYFINVNKSDNNFLNFIKYELFINSDPVILKDLLTILNFSNKKLVVYKSKHKKFCINVENPIVVIPLGNLSDSIFKIKTQKYIDIFYYLPISSDMCIALIHNNDSNDNDLYINVSSQMVSIINKLSFNNGDVICSENDFVIRDLI